MFINLNSPYIEWGNLERNLKTHINLIDKSDSNLNVFLETYITGYKCGEFFFNNKHLNNSGKNLVKIHEFCRPKIKIAILGILYNFGFILFLSRIINKSKIELCNPQKDFKDTWIKTWIAINQKSTNIKIFRFDFSSSDCFRVLSDLINPF